MILPGGIEGDGQPGCGEDTCESLADTEEARTEDDKMINKHATNKPFIVSMEKQTPGNIMLDSGALE